MTLKENGLSCLSSIWQPIGKHRHRWAIILLILLGLFVFEELGRRIVLANSLYSLNLHTNINPPILPSPKSGEKILIFAPHEDDETLGCAGYIQQAVAAGARVHVVLMTNGEFPEIDVVLFEESFPTNARAYLRLGYRRQRETLAAMRYLGLPANSVTFLGYPNQYLNQMWLPSHWQPRHPVRSIRTRVTVSPYRNSFTRHAVYCGQSMLGDIETILRREQPNTILTLHPNDIHVDHWPTYTFVRFALEELIQQGYPFAARCTVYTYLIHRDFWPAPRGYWPALNLEPPAKLAHQGTTEWFALPLTVAQTIDKHKATALYRSQAGAFDPLLRSFARANELYGVLPVTNWPTQPHVRLREVLRDAAADLASSALNAHGDILHVWLARNGQRGTVEIRTRGTISQRVRYHLVLHGGGRSIRERSFVQYDWQGDSITGLCYTNGRLQTIARSRLFVGHTRDTIILTFPWPFDAKQKFFLVRAWSTSGKRTVDQTITNTFRISEPEQNLYLVSSCAPMQSQANLYIRHRFSPEKSTGYLP